MSAVRATRMIGGLAAALAAALAGCSGPQAYGTGQAMQREACQRIADPERQRECMAGARAPYETYRREAEGARQGR